MAAQNNKQKQQKLLVTFFDFFGCLLTQNSTNQGSQLSWFYQTMWKTIRKSKNMGP